MKTKLTCQMNVLLLLTAFILAPDKAISRSAPVSSTESNKLMSKVIEELEDKYQVFFSYDKSLLNEIYVDFEFNQNENVHQAIDRLLATIDINYVLVGDKYFVLYPDTEEGRNNVGKIKRHFKKIQRIELQSQINVGKRKTEMDVQFNEVVKKAIGMAPRESVKISGSVKDEDGESLPGAAIYIKGNPTKGTIADPNGNFTIEVSTPVTLVISYVGFTSKEIEITGTDQEVHVVLEQGFTLDDVIVTARRRPEGIQETPISITAIQGSILEEMGVDDISGIGDIAPNLTFSTTGTVSGSSSAAVVYIRGVGQNDYVPVADPGVGIYVDDVYLGRTIGAVLDLANLKSVEVIRGPQGTLFGRNTIGGAISLSTDEPGKVFGGSVRVTGGSYDRSEIAINFTGPLSPTVGFSLSAINKDRKGYVERVFVENSWLGNENMSGFKSKFNIQKPNSKFKAQFIVDYVNENEESAAEQNLYFHDDRLLPSLWNTNNALAVTSTASGYVPGDITAGTDIYDQRWNFGPFKTGETSLSQNLVKTYGISGNFGLDHGNGLSSKLILATRGLEAAFSRQVDGSPLNIFENRDLYDQNQYSADYRIAKSTDKLDVVAGLFYFQEKVDNLLIFTGSLEGSLYPIIFGGLVDNSNYAAYGEATYKLTDKLSLTAGLRYTNETKKATPDAYRAPSADINDGIPEEPAPIRNATTNPLRLIDKIELENSFDQVTWRLNLAYKLTKELNVYGTASTGFKSGGFEWRVTNTSFYDDPAQDFDGDGDGDLPQFKPETVQSFEVGTKLDLQNSDFRWNTAFFLTNYEDMQIAANPPGSIATFQTNAGNAKITGLETEIIWLPTNDILINLGYGLIDARYTDLIEGVTVTKEDHFILTPKHTLTFGASYKASFNGQSITPRIDGHYKSEVDFEAENSDYVVDDGHVAINGSLKYMSKNKWSLTLGVDNLTDELYIIGGDANTAIGYENGIYARPRNYYATFKINF
jgi:iron complex outermembrane recepter protein